MALNPVLRGIVILLIALFTALLGIIHVVQSIVLLSILTFTELLVIIIIIIIIIISQTETLLESYKLYTQGHQQGKQSS